MLFTRSTQYAIQALVLLATTPNGRPVMTRELAERLHVPTAYLSKLMNRFSRAGVLQSTRGRHGGYRLACDPSSLSLREVILIVRGEHALQECFLGLKTCSDETACAMHCRWQPIKQRVYALLAAQNLGLLAAALRSGRCRLGDINASKILSVD